MARGAGDYAYSASFPTGVQARRGGNELPGRTHATPTVMITGPDTPPRRIAPTRSVSLHEAGGLSRHAESRSGCCIRVRDSEQLQNSPRRLVWFKRDVRSGRSGTSRWHHVALNGSCPSGRFRAAYLGRIGGTTEPAGSRSRTDSGGSRVQNAYIRSRNRRFGRFLSGSQNRRVCRALMPSEDPSDPSVSPL